MGRVSNCFVAALWFWFASSCRAYLWTRRSLHFRGLIPHFGVAVPEGGRGLRVVEYIPQKGSLWSLRNIVVAFDGEFRVWELRAVRCRRFKTLAEVRCVLAEGQEMKKSFGATHGRS